MRYLPNPKSPDDYLIGDIERFNHYSKILTYNGFSIDEYIMWKQKWKEFYNKLTIELRNIKKNSKLNYKIKYNSVYHRHFICLAQDMMFWKNEMEEKRSLATPF